MQRKPACTALVVAATVLLLAAPLAAQREGELRPSKMDDEATAEQLAAENIAQAQDLLRAAGFDPGQSRGVLDVRTEEAIRQFQQAKGLPVTGVLDDRTRAALLDNSPTMDQASRTRGAAKP